MSNISVQDTAVDLPVVVTSGASRTIATAWAGIIASIASATLLVIPAHWTHMVGTLLLIGFSAGASVTSWVDIGDGYAQAGLTLVLSLTITAIASALMIWSSAWHPDILAALAVVSLLSCVARLYRGHGAWAWNMPIVGRQLCLHVTILFFGLGAWAYGVSQINWQTIGSYGLLASANIWFFAGLAALLAGSIFELTRPDPRSWLLSIYLVSLIVAIYATVPILYGAPEYAWVYKHIGVAQALQQYGHIIDPTDIYQQWPVLFSGVASLSALSRVSPFSFAVWAPLAFELVDAFLILAIYRLLGADRRLAFVSVFLYAGLIAWIGQDYLSPQAFGFTLWLGIAAILVRWFLGPSNSAHGQLSIISRARKGLLRELPESRESAPAGQAVAGILIAVIFFAIVAAHQLTPYVALIGVGGLVILGLLRRGWLLLVVMGAIAVGYLIPRYGLVSSQFGGLFSGGDAISNASGVKAYNKGGESFSANVTHVLAALMWLAAAASIVRQWRTLGRVATVAVLAFSPFVVLFLQNYGGEAIFRVYMFSAPWCAFLIGRMMVQLRAPLWRALAMACGCSIALALGLQGQYGSVAIDAFPRSELTASLWLYSHAPRGSLLVLPVEDFPALEVADYNDYNLQFMPSDPLSGGGSQWLNEGNISEVEKWIYSFDNRNMYVIFSRTETAYANYFGDPENYGQLEKSVHGRSGWSVIYHNTDTTIYRVQVRLPAVTAAYCPVQRPFRNNSHRSALSN